MRKTRRHSLLVALAGALACALALGGCSADASSQLTVSGSTTMLPIAEMAAEGFQERTGTHVLVSGLGSSAGIEAVSNGTADIATASRGLTADEQAYELVDTVVAHDGIAIIVNDGNSVRDVSLSQLRDIYAGKVTNWSQLGGADMPILAVNRDEASGTREAFRSIVMGDAAFDRSLAVLPGTGQVRDVVSRTPGAIGYISIGFVANDSGTKVRALSVDGVEATEDSVEDGTYPISRDLYFFTNGDPRGTTYDFISYVLSDDMAQTIRDAGYIPVDNDATPGKGGDAK